MWHTIENAWNGQSYDDFAICNLSGRLAGGGALEVELTMRLRAYASAMGGGELLTLTIDAFADAMEIILAGKRILPLSSSIIVGIGYIHPVSIWD